MGGSVKRNIGKTKRTISTIRMMVQGQATYMERLWSKLFRKVQKYQNGSRKDKEGQEKELLPGNTSARIYECYGT